MSTNGYVVVLKREPDKCFINNYNPSVMLAWQADMDIQFVLNAYACVMYVASYILKTKRSMVKRVATEGIKISVEKSWVSIPNTQRSECTRSCV